MKIGAAHEAAVDASAETCMAILLDVPGYTEWWPGLVEATVVKPGEQPEIRLVFDSHAPGIGKIDLNLRQIPEGHARLTLEYLGGRLDSVEGAVWSIAPDGGGCRVGYAIEAEMDTGLPKFLEKPFAEPAKRFLAVEPVEALKRRAEQRG